MNIGDIVSRKAEGPDAPKYKIVSFDRDTYQENHDTANGVRLDQLDNPNAYAIPFPRYKWDFFTIHEESQP